MSLSKDQWIAEHYRILEGFADIAYETIVSLRDIGMFDDNILDDLVRELRNQLH